MNILPRINRQIPKKAVLLVDDERLYLDSAAFCLRASGISNIIKCDESKLVLSILKETECSLVVLDNNMPYKTGAELLIEIKGLYPGLPVVMLSAITESGIQELFIENGAADYVTKPIEKKVFVKVVRSLLAEQL